jgi:hypothetical protein
VSNKTVAIFRLVFTFCCREEYFRASIEVPFGLICLKNFTDISEWHLLKFCAFYIPFPKKIYKKET